MIDRPSGSGRAPLSPAGTARLRLAPPAGFPGRLMEELRDADVPEPTLYLAWQVAEWAPRQGLPPGEREALFGLVARALLAVGQGSTRLRVGEGEQALLRKVPALVATGGSAERRPLILEGDHLYLQKLLACEERLAVVLRRRLGAPGLWDGATVAAAVAQVVAAGRPAPTTEQAGAVRAALGGRFAVITGGPGTGKTTIAVALVRALARLGVPPAAVALAAPTGKAANRLEQAVRAGLAAAGTAPAARGEGAAGETCPPAETLHRLLGYSPGSGMFQRDEHDPLGQRVVIVDEGSMIDLFLMERLCRSVREDALLVLMGDADQLPSVAAGAVFRDVAPLGVRLTRSFRVDPAAAAGRRILEAARAVNEGDAAALLGGGPSPPIAERSGPEALCWDGVELLPAAAREAVLERWYDERIAPAAALAADRVFAVEGDHFVAADDERLGALHALHQASRVLAVTRGRPSGVDAVNAWLHRRHAAGGGGPGGGPDFLPGQPVMIGKNDYQRGLFNGDQGVVVAARIRGRTRLVAAFPTSAAAGGGGRWVPWELDGLRDTLALSFAMTVHKAQGSEYDQVLLLLPDAPLPLLSRELLYTALTRSRRSVVVCGSPAVLVAAVNNALARSSGIAARLAARDG